MSEGIRLRSNAKMTERNNSNSASSRQGLTLESMKSASPQHTGNVMKLHIPYFYSIIPIFLQLFMKRVASKFPFLSFLLPSWKPRYLVLLGSFVYKFAEDKGKPKGSPIPLDSLDVQLVMRSDPDLMFLDFEKDIPSGYGAVFCISNLRKKYYFACSDISEATTWINSLRQARQESVTRSMGHAPQDSYPPKWKYFDSHGRSLLKSKDRIHMKMEQQSLHEMELIGISGGPIPRGYYG